MRKREPWGLIIVDEDQKKYAFTGVITDDGPWTERVCKERERGRNIRCFDHEQGNDRDLPEWESRLGLSRTTVEDILLPPEDTSAVYTGSLPDYAAHANRRRLVKILCRGQCSRTRWAELDCDYPGKDALKTMGMGTFHATCLVCGYTASDNYNWMRD